MKIATIGRVTVGPDLYAGEREFRVGRRVAYGTIDVSPDGSVSYAVLHAPDQASMETICRALEEAEQ
jgi:hypothetical protein